MRFEFQIVDGPSTGRRFFLSPSTELTVGRTEEAEQAIPSDLIMSSLHFKLQADNTGCHLQDLSSTNGTFVNGRRVQQATLNDRDTITAGGTTFELRIGRSPVPSPSVSHKPVATPAAQSTPPARVFEQSDFVRATTDRVLPDSGPSKPETGQGTGSVARLEIDGQFGSRTVSIHQGQPTIFGRTERADVVVPDEMISSVHFSLNCEGNAVVLHDLGSSNGTFKNKQRIEQTMLEVGDRFVAGRTEFRLVELRPRQPDAPVTSAEQKVSTTSPVSIQETDRVKESEPPVRPIEQPPTSETPAAPKIAPSHAQAMEGPKAVIQTTSSIRSKWPYDKGLTDEDCRVRASALLAAVWSRQPWLLDQCRTAASAPNRQQLNELLLLAILGDEHDLPLFQTIGISNQLGTERFRLLGNYGHPRTVPLLLAGLDSEEMETAYFAGKAFTKITGADIDSDRTAEIPDSTGAEPSEVVLPDSSLARNCWDKLEPKISSATRVSRGVVLQPSPQEQSDDTTLDMETRLETAIREIYSGGRHPTSELLLLALGYLSADRDL